MTKQQLRKKFKELRREASQHLDALLEIAIKSGAVDLAGYEGATYRLPRIILKAALLSEAGEQLLNGQDEKQVQDLRRFI